MPGAAVFPGGAVDSSDRDGRWADLCGMDDRRAASLLGLEVTAGALGYFVAAIRETYEEVGLLISPAGNVVDRRIARDGAAFLDACLDSDVHLDVARLVPAGRWVTPMGAPIRFDAQFFVAIAPDGFVCDPDIAEVAECRWLAPSAALAGLAAGDYLMAPPTIEMLQRLDAHRSVDEVMASMEPHPSKHATITSTRLSPVVHAVIAPNAGLMTGPGTNTYVVGTGPTLVIDPAVDDVDYLRAVTTAAGEVAEIVVTHRHPDHTGGVRALRAATGARVRAWGTESIDDTEVTPLADGDTLEVPGLRMTALHTPGHSSDHVCVYAASIASLFAGDNVLGEGTALIAPPDGNMREYLQTLQRLLELEIDRIYPGHFRALDGGRAVIEHYIAHRADRHSSIVETLRSGSKTVDQIVELVYVDTPPVLHPVARYSVLAHLAMLEEEGGAVTNGDFWALTGV